MSLNQYNHTIEQGYEYEVSFYARKESGGEFILQIQEDVDPWENFEWERFDVTNLWKKYSVTFTPDATVNNTVRVSLYFGETTGEWYIDKFTLLRKPTN